jgi:hypothetical protein
MSDEQLDLEIDRAVREMMSVDAPGGFRARILSRLEKQPRRFGWMTFAGFGTVGAAAAVVLLVMRTPAPVQRTTPIPPPPQVAREVPRPPETASSAVPAPPGISKPPADIERGPAVDRQVAATMVLPQPPQPESMIAALEEIDPLHVPPVSAPDISPAAITIAPLPDIPRVEIKPLSPPNGRD